MTIDLEELAAVIRLIKEAEFSEFRYAKGDVSLVVRRGALANGAGEEEPAARPVPPKPAPLQAKVETVPGARAEIRETPAQHSHVGGPVETVKAPLLGTFYSAPKPGEPPFVKVGMPVAADTVICIIEVMKLMNSVVAGVAGVVAAVHVSDGELVEHGQVLFSITPAA